MMSFEKIIFSNAYMKHGAISWWGVEQIDSEHPEVLDSANLYTLLLGSVVAFIVSVLAIKFFIDFLKKHGFRVWGIYRIIVGVIMLLLIWFGVIAH